MSPASDTGAVRRAASGSALVLCYHAVSDRWPEQSCVTPAELASHLELLAGRGYRGVTFSEAVTAPPEDRVVAITFDDGFRSVFTAGLPVLRRFGFRATAFVPTGHISEGKPLAWPGFEGWLGTAHEDELSPFDWSEASALLESGWEIGSHSIDHPHLPELEDDELQRQLVESRRECEHQLGVACDSIAYPFGSTDARVIAAAGRAGYRFGAATLFERWGEVSSLHWPRVPVLRGDSRMRLRKKISPLLLRLRATAAWPALAGAWRRTRFPGDRVS